MVHTFIATMKMKTKSRGRMITSRFLRRSLHLRPSPAVNSFMTSPAMRVSTPAAPREAIMPVVAELLTTVLMAELLTMVLTVVVTVEIISLSLTTKSKA